MINSLMAAMLILTSTAVNDCEMRVVEHLAQEAQIIAVAKVEEVEPTLGFGSGYFVVVQRVNYEIEEVLKGDLPKGRINVAHLVVANSPTADEETGQMQLSPKLFAKGNRLVLFLEPDPQRGYIGIDSAKTYKGYMALSENCVPRAEAETLKAIQRTLSKTNK